jgi:hypothetical protein
MAKDKFRADIEGECLGVNFKFVNEDDSKERVLLYLRTRKPTVLTVG